MRREQFYRMRHQAFCVEHGYWAVRDDGLETDCYDEHSVPVLVFDGDDLVGGSRMVLSRPLPIEEAVQLSECFAGAGEISRTVLVPKYRHSAGAFRTIIRSTVNIAVEYRLPWIVALLEPSLARYIERYGIILGSLGPMIEHKGWRRPYGAVTAQCLAASCV